MSSAPRDFEVREYRDVLTGCRINASLSSSCPVLSSFRSMLPDLSAATQAEIRSWIDARGIGSSDGPSQAFTKPRRRVLDEIRVPTTGFELAEFFVSSVYDYVSSASPTR